MILQLTTYASALKAAFDGGYTWPASAALTLTLHTSTYTPNIATHTSVADLTNELGSGSGYTAGGTTLATATSTIVAANSWTVARANGTAYSVGQVVRPAVANTYLYRCVVAGTSDSSPPSYPTVIGTTVADATVTWACVGKAGVILDAADLAPAWAAFSAGPFRHVVLSDRTAVGAANQPLIGVYTYGSDQTGGGGAFNVTFDASGVLCIPV